MSTHYNQILTETFEKLGYTVVYQPSCLQMPYDGNCWPIQFPEVNWQSNTLVVMHCQDYVSIKNGVCPELQCIESHFSDHADQVVVIHWNMDLTKVYKGSMHLLHFPTHSYELMLNLAGCYQDWQQSLDKVRTTAFQCLNGFAKPHRKLVANYLKKFYPHGVISLGTQIPLLQCNYATYEQCDNVTNWMRLQSVYGDCDVNVVTETQYYEDLGIISEKTLMAFLALQVPIVIGYPGIIAHCEQLGFDMFRDIVDTDYEYADHSSRWKQALYLNSYLLCNGIDRQDLIERLVQNQKLALELPEKLVELFVSKVSTNFPDRCKGEPS